MNSLYSKKLFFSIKAFHLLWCVIIASVLPGCKKMVEVDSPSSYTTDDLAYATDGNAISVLNGIYASMSSARLNGGLSINSFLPIYAGLSADEFTLYSGVTTASYRAFYPNALLNTTSPNPWTVAYPFIYRANVAIEGLNKSTTLSDIVKKELLGEAKFIRAFHYFYLVNLYGPVPLPLSSDYKTNLLLSRASVDDVYKQIVQDLQDASTLLNTDFVGTDGHTSSTERVVPNSWTAKALLARVYLYMKDYNSAVSLSTAVIDNTTLFDLTDLNDVFLRNSREAIWQLQPVNLGWNTEDARLFIIPKAGPGNNTPVYLNSDLLNSFETGDQRMDKWVNNVTVNGVTYNYPYKYKSATLNLPVTEYQMIFRLAEQYLVRAEANTQLGNFSAAVGDLNKIRNRAGLPGYVGAQNKDDLVTAILHERRIEFFSEMGHRWLDLKRTNLVDAVMTSATQQKGGTWSTNAQYFPISATELDRGPNLVQNNGY